MSFIYHRNPGQQQNFQRVIEQISIGAPDGPSRYPSTKGDIDMGGAPVQSKLSELFNGKLVNQAAMEYWLAELKGITSPNVFKKKIVNSYQVFALVGSEEEDPERRKKLKEALKVIDEALTSQQILAIYRGLLLQG